MNESGPRNARSALVAGFSGQGRKFSPSRSTPSPRTAAPRPALERDGACPLAIGPLRAKPGRKTRGSLPADLGTTTAEVPLILVNGVRGMVPASTTGWEPGRRSGRAQVPLPPRRSWCGRGGCTAREVRRAGRLARAARTAGTGPPGPARDRASGRSGPCGAVLRIVGGGGMKEDDRVVTGLVRAPPPAATVRPHRGPSPRGVRAVRHRHTNQ
jgi:hypothetical protein